MNVRVRITAVILVAFGLFFACPTIAWADDAAAVPTPDDDTIYVGLSEYPHYGYYDDSGNVAGCDVEFVYKIAEYANMKVKIVLIPDAETYFSSLDNGRVDILFDAIKTDERAQKYLYADNESGNTPNSVYVSSADERFEYGNIDQLRTLTFGSESGSYVTQLFESWCASHGFTPAIKEYADSAGINAAIDAGEVDAGIYGTSSVEGYRTILQFSPTPYYCIFRSGDSALKERVDTAMSKILLEDPLYKSKLLQKYTVSSEYDMTALTSEATAYVDQHPTLNVAVINNDAPYFTQDGTDGPGGIIPDYYSEISDLTGLNVQYKVYDSHASAVEAMMSGDADILGMYSDGLVAAYESGLRLTSPYATVNAAEVTRAGDDPKSVKTIAVKQRTRDAIAASAGFEDAELLVSKNTQECFDAVRSGRADATICGMPSATWLINQTNASLYNITPLSSLNFDLCGALPYDNATLCSIMNKAIFATQYSFTGITTNNTVQEQTWESTISHIPAAWIAAFAAIAVLLVLGLVFALIALTHRQREAAAVAAAKAENERREIQLSALAASNEERNRFFSNISHDMRTPLNAIIGFSGLAKEKAVVPEVQDYLGKIETSGNLLLGLIDDTLTISKINSGKLKLDPQPTPTNDVFNPIIVPIREAAHTKGIQFTFNNQGKNRTLLLDKLNVQKIFLNLLSNAIKYTPEGGHVTLKLWNEPSKTGAADFDSMASVSDDGIGIAADFLPHIYEPFVQENKSGQMAAGTGLGLSIVKQMVEMMDGTIDVESRPNKGTRFTLRLHFPDAEPSADHAHDTTRNDAANLSTLTVLLCEDNELNSELATTLLQAKGVHVLAAANGQVGVDLFTASAPGEIDVVLMDIRMPVMNGYEAARAIRALDRSDAQTVPIVAMTADAFPDDIARCREAGMNVHISKPIDRAVLYDTLSHLS